MTSQNAIMVIDPHTAIEAAKGRKQIVAAMWQQEILRSGVDYGVIQGTEKPSLWKPGAERLCAAFGLDPRFETLTAIEKWDGDEPLFYYRIRCSLVHIETGLEIATGIGSCNSRESKYRWRWVKESDMPPHKDKALLVSRSAAIREFAFSVDKAETTGKYGKPDSYWQQFRDAIANGTAKKIKMETARGKALDGWEIGGTEYRMPNEDIFSLINTIDKMAQKRALIAATLIGANASEFFTQDVEDLPEFADVVEGHATVFHIEPETSATKGESVQTAPPPAPKQSETPKQPAPNTDNPYTRANAAAKAEAEQPATSDTGSEAPGAGEPDWMSNQAIGVVTMQVVNTLKGMDDFNPAHIQNYIKKARKEGAYNACATLADAVRITLEHFNTDDPGNGGFTPEPAPENMSEIPF